MVVFDFKKYEQSFFDDAIKHLNAEFDASPDMPKKIKLIPKFFEVKLSADTINLAQGAQIVCIFVNDTCDASILTRLSELGVQMIALRCAGFNNVDLEACKALGISVVRVPAYSPYAVAEHCVALLSTLNRKLHIAYNRVKTGNFSLTSLTGFDIRGKTVGVIGTGKIGVCFIKIMLGFGANVVGYDPYKSKELEGVANFRYVEEIAELLSVSKILSIHVPLTDKNKYLINKDTLALMPKGAIIVNTSRGGLVHTGDLIDALKSGHIGGAGLDVYEDESEYFFEDKSGEIIRDEKLARLLTLKNVIVTSHQAFLTNEALHAIANTTIFNIREFLVEGKAQKALTNSVNLA
ncbi:lactate dehydrogenase-like oxidoreductase [Cladochytrium replicatum]|nr:lactate dehydrogenase-like oxidoreductase [Cladochytrium replicatum]